MNVQLANVLFMISLAVFSAVAAAVLAVVFERWWNTRSEARRAETEALEKEFPSGG